MTTTLFIVTSGRSGSYLLHKILSLYPNVESHHEYCIEHTQKLSVLHRAGIVSDDHAALQLRDTHYAGVWHSQADYFCDSSNKLSYLINPLRVILPEALFIYLVRDGRRVVSSYYHKLADECYTDRWVTKLSASLTDSRIYPYPPPIKAAYWPMPDPFREPETYRTFVHRWDRWQRLCWFWQDCNKAILKGLEGIPDEQKATFNLEDLTGHIRDLADLLDWVGLLNSKSILDKAWSLCQTPQNVSEPVSYPLTQEQAQQYWEICGEMHEQLGYNKDDYEVQYKGD